jgi:hypothetical protein
MKPMNPKIRKPLYHLIDILPEEELHTAFRFLEFLAKVKDVETREPPLTMEERADCEENLQAILRGEGIPWEEVRKGLADE